MKISRSIFVVVMNANRFYFENKKNKTYLLNNKIKENNIAYLIFINIISQDVLEWSKNYKNIVKNKLDGDRKAKKQMSQMEQSEKIVLKITPNLN